MGLLISQIAKEMTLGDTIQISDEKEFDIFSRTTTEADGRQCIFLTDSRYIKNISASVTMVITTEEIAPIINDKDFGICITDEPRGLFFELLSYHEKTLVQTSERTVIGEGCEIKKTAVISDFGVRIGNNVHIGDYVVIHPNVVIGDNVTIQTGARIGEQDFNIYSYKGISKQVYHSGKVIIGSNVLISSGVLVGQAMYSYGCTFISDYCFIGAGTCIGHNSEIGSHCEICAKTTLGGYCCIAENTKIYMGVTIANALKIGKDVTINMGSVVVRDIQDAKTVFGNPAKEVIKPPI